jgi:RsiW-degrading membrane proteinase PrsW (M82 family)
MPIEVTCECGRQLRARDAQAGRQCKCPACGRLVLVPAPPPPPALTLAYAGLATPPVAEPLIHGEERPLPVIARPTQDVAKLERSWRGNVYWLLLLAMIPLAFVSISPRATVKERIEQTLKNNPSLRDGFERAMSGYRDIDDVLDKLPGKRIDGAFLSRGSVYHLPMALASAGLFLILALHALPSSVKLKEIVLTAAFTGTLSVLLLLGLQFFGMFCCIGMFYLAAMHPDSPFGPSLLGFVFGIGFCEETIKCLPVLWKLYRRRLLSWRDSAVIGMASGAGFGVSEGILYSMRYYNGLETGDIYVVRFLSTVALHTMLSGACAIIIQRKQEHLIEDTDPINWIMTLMAIIVMPILMHGLFDALAKKEMMLGALGVAVGSFFWMAWLIRAARRRESSIATHITGPRMVRTPKGTIWVES